MNDKTLPTITISVDLKKYRIRIHKSTLHLLGDPRFIQLLVNPEDKVVAIRSVDHAQSGDQAHKINQQRMLSDNSIEIYSRYFIETLRDVVGVFDDGVLFRLTGQIIPEQRIAVFSLKTLKRMEG